MSLLAPLYILGALAISLPVLFHLIRRSPRGRMLFSSLMFLSPSPPRLTRRSRLDNLLLLLLRIAALILLAVAFARPFLREATRIPLAGDPGMRVAILVDTSASMRRGDLWAQVRERVEELLAELKPVDDVALFAFDDDLREVVGFEAAGAIPRGQRASALTARLSELHPTWGSTDLGGALLALADALDASFEDDSSNEEEAPRRALRIVAVTDLQQGTSLEALQSYAWPVQVRLTVERVAVPAGSNAGVILLGDPESPVEGDQRVRVSNEADSGLERFSLAWAKGDNENPAGAVTEVYVPAGEARVVPATRPVAGVAVDRLVLRGDDHDFDNSFFFVPPVRKEVTILYIGREKADDPDGLRYYAELALTSDARREVRFEAHAPDRPLPPSTGSQTPLTLVVGSVDPVVREGLLRRARSGGTVLHVLESIASAPTLGALLECDDLRAEEAAPDAYAMLGDIDFAHPLFVSFADPRFSDFTRVRFWRHRRVEVEEESGANTPIPGVSVVASFDNGAPAILERAVGEGRIVALTSGWHPRDSQLSRSSKFVPLLLGLLQHSLGGTEERTSFVVNEMVPTPVPKAEEDGAADTGLTRRVRKPDGTEVLLAADATRFDEADQPGIYELDSGGVSRLFAVNLAPSESKTAPLAIEELEQRGVSLGVPARNESLERRLRDVELESSQKLWRWLVVVALGLLILETGLAGRKGRSAVGEVVTP